MGPGSRDSGGGDKSGRGPPASGFCLPLSVLSCAPFPTASWSFFFSFFFLNFYWSIVDLKRCVLPPVLQPLLSSSLCDKLGFCTIYFLCLECSSLRSLNGSVLYFGSQCVVPFSERPFLLLAGCTPNNFYGSMLNC